MLEKTPQNKRTAKQQNAEILYVLNSEGKLVNYFVYVFIRVLINRCIY